jgi:hypothetical protein
MFIYDEVYSRIFKRLNDLDGVIRGTVIPYQEFPVLVSLRYYGFYCPADGVRTVAHGHNKAD